MVMPQLIARMHVKSTEIAGSTDTQQIKMAADVVKEMRKQT
jgi:hypothetical protein